MLTGTKLLGKDPRRLFRFAKREPRLKLACFVASDCGAVEPHAAKANESGYQRAAGHLETGEVFRRMGRIRAFHVCMAQHQVLLSGSTSLPGASAK
eukprot:762160-Hanusia_phi.AAC.2